MKPKKTNRGFRHGIWGTVMNHGDGMSRKDEIDSPAIKENTNTDSVDNKWHQLYMKRKIRITLSRRKRRNNRNYSVQAEALAAEVVRK